jgi:ASC-1-like (ASCH) protein
MQHEMGLYAQPFEAIQAGRKRYEIRLHDEKRQRIAIGDTIAFTRLPDGAGPLRVEVIGLRRYPTFEDLYKDIPLADIDCEGWTMPDLLASTYTIYTLDQEARYGALAIEIKLLP